VYIDVSCVDVHVVVMVRTAGLNGVMNLFPSSPQYKWGIATYASLSDIVSQVVTGINSVGCLPVVSSMFESWSLHYRVSQ